MTVWLEAERTSTLRRVKPERAESKQPSCCGPQNDEAKSNHLEAVQSFESRPHGVYQVFAQVVLDSATFFSSYGRGKRTGFLAN